jgi:DNA-binding SARP family transcriptional activator/ABC-type branched-subunit amino acid transport system substrate-binding protein/streptogramin lyase
LSGYLPPEGEASEMDFRILGPLEVADEGRRVELGGRKQRALLAILLVHANEVVSADKLIDELWAETPPPTAAKTLQAHVSRLRRSINVDGSPKGQGGPLVTRGQGYILKVEPGQLDAERFQRLLEDGRRALARGEAGFAAQKLDEALALWRGPALADFVYESFAQEEIARLEELRLGALEERLEAELALGRHAEVVAELEALLARHPLRERLRGQLMLALYRSGRQAEALEVYQRGRRALAEELGLEPSQPLQRLERQILGHDPELAAPARAEAPRASPPVRRRPRLVVVAGALILAAAVGTALFQLTRPGTEAAPESDRAVDGTGVGVLDPRTGELVSTIRLGTSPANVAVGEGGVWVLDADDRTISKVDPNERTLLRTFSTGSTPTSIAVGAGAIWIGNGGESSYPGSISRIDPDSGAVDATIDLPGSGVRGYFQGGGTDQQLIAVTDEAVWVINRDFTVSRIDPRTNRVVATIADVAATSIATGEGEVWVVGDEGVAEIDPATNAVSRRIEVAAESLTSLAVGAGAVWVADPVGGSVWRVDVGREHVLRTIPLELGVGWVAFGEGAVWATNEVADTVHRIDPTTNRARVVRRMPAPAGVAVGEEGVWVTSAGQLSADAALPASACGDVFYGGAGSPRFLIVSDLPLQGTREFTLPMVEAIRFVLERRGFKAGPYTVGYQSCDDSTAQAGGFDAYRCLSNAKAYARTPHVLGVIGTFNYGCSQVEIPVANQAPGGPLAMISPSNTPTFLTRPVRGIDPDELEQLYPSGERNYVRIAAADHLAARALAQAAKELGNERVAVLWDRDDPDGDVAAYAADMRERAQTLGLEVVDEATWNPRARSFDRLARRVAAARPDAVLFTGAGPPHVDALLRDLRARLARGVALIASDGFWGVSGPAAQGMYIGNYGIPNSELPPKGRRFLAELEADGGDPGPDFSAAYGAQAAEILLDAIARSDGTRPSVTRELFRTNVEDGILGDIRFDENGDLVEGPVTIYRIAGNRAVVDRVVIASLTTGG